MICYENHSNQTAQGFFEKMEVNMDKNEELHSKAQEVHWQELRYIQKRGYYPKAQGITKVQTAPFLPKLMFI